MTTTKEAPKAQRSLPILFSGAMVRALIDGVKTQTRRVINPQPSQQADVFDPYNGNPDHFTAWSSDGKMFLDPGNVTGTAHWRCHHGRVGDHLYVRETVRLVGRRHRGTERRSVLYPATCCPGTVKGPFIPSILMPRWASRITLEVLVVRAQKLQEITEADARAEGVREVTKDGQLKKYCIYDNGDMSTTPWADMPRTARDAYRALWDSLNAKRGFGWDKNPWVWVIEFKRIAP